MAAEIKYTVFGDPRTKKNHQMIAGAGSKCPVCKKSSCEVSEWSSTN